MIVISISYVLP